MSPFPFFYILKRWTITSFIIFIFFSIECKAQSLFELVKQKKSTVVFLGLDFTHARFVGKSKFNSRKSMKDVLITPLNYLLGAERKKYDLAGSMHFPESQYTLDAEYLIRLNDIETDEQLFYDTDTILTDKDLQQAVHDYELTRNSGMGISLIVENLNGNKEIGSFWVTFFDLSTKKIIIAENIKGKAGGAGLRNYWAHAVFDVIQDMESVVYKRIKKGNYLSESASYWQDKYKGFVPLPRRTQPVRKNDYAQNENVNIDISSTSVTTNQNTDSMLLESIINDKIDDNRNLEKLRFDAFLIYIKDRKRAKALKATAIISEYLGDYELAANLYAAFLKKLNPEADKDKISEARAHQITCNFLKQSDEKNTKPAVPDAIQISGYGLITFVINGHVFVNSVMSNSAANKAGLLPCDEIKMINGSSFADEWVTQENIESKMAANQTSSCRLTITRVGVNEPMEIIMKNEPATAHISDISKDTLELTSYTDATKLNERQNKKQGFLIRIVTQMQKDTLLTKILANSQKISYALSVLNKWAKSPIDNKIFAQIDEQLGMVSSLISIIKGNNPNFNFNANGKVSFGNPELKELVSTDYSKAAQSKFDSVAQTQPIKETKIDDNITFVENSKSNYSGFYKCIDIFLANAPMNARKSFCLEPETWVTVTNEANCENRTRESFIKLGFSGTNYSFEMTRESIMSPCKNGNEALTFYNGGGYTKTHTVASGNVDLKSATVVTTYTSTTYMKMESSKHVFHFLGTNKEEISPGFEKTVTENPQNITQHIEFLSDSKIKFTSEQGWSILQKVKDL